MDGEEEDLKERQENEMEALKSIFGDDLKDTRFVSFLFSAIK